MEDYSKYKVGDKDEAQQEILFIYAKTKNYVIYDIQKVGNVSCMVNPETLPSNFQSISTHLDKVNKHLTNDSLLRKFCKRLAHAYKSAFEGDITKSKGILADLEKEIVSYKTSVGRLNYLLTCSIFVVINIIISLILWLVRGSNGNLITISIVFNSALFGSFGGFMSIAYKVKSLKIDLDVENRINIMNSFIRIFYSMLAGIVIFILVKAKIVLNILSDIDDSSNYPIYGIAVAAGLIESYVPNLFKEWSK